MAKKPETIKYTTLVTRETRKALKIQAAKEERPAWEIVQQAIEEYIARRQSKSGS